MSPEIRRLERDQLADGYSYPVDFWAIGIMLIQLLCGDAMDFYDEATDLSNLAEDLLSGRLISAEALSLVRGLLEVDPKKRLGSATSPHGSIREHAFFRVGEGIDWDSVDEGILKSIHRRPDVSRTLIHSNSIFSISANSNLFGSIP
jgi:serine/threonine protein kinase